MHLFSLRPLQHRKVIGLCSILCLILCAEILCFAQGSGRDMNGTGGSHIISGKIFFPSGRRAEGSIQVKLRSLTTPDISIMTDSSGSFSFSNIAPGNYTVEVNAGKDYEVAEERVSVEPDIQSVTGMPAVQVSRRYTVMITLQPKRTENTKASVVNAALAEVPDDARTLYEKALALSQKGDTAKAIEDLRAAISIYPQFPLALNQLGVEYLKIGNARQAIEPLHSATELKPEAFSPRLNYGIALLETHQFASAETQLRAALKISSTPSAHMYLGMTLIGIKHIDDAQKELETAISNGGENLGQAHYYLGGIYWQKHDYRRAADEIETYLRLTPDAPDAQKVRDTIKELRAKL